MIQQLVRLVFRQQEEQLVRQQELKMIQQQVRQEQRLLAWRKQPESERQSEQQQQI